MRLSLVPYGRVCLLLGAALLADCEREPEPVEPAAPPEPAAPLERPAVTPPPAPRVAVPADDQPVSPEPPSETRAEPEPPKPAAPTAPAAKRKPEPPAIEQAEVEAPALDLSLPEDWAAEIVPDEFSEQALLPPLFHEPDDGRVGLRGRLIEGPRDQDAPDGAELEFEFRR